ncbi:MAG: diguanylate cyclase, partial [Humidesulfovibrio sp.]|nr:diguanylate cyclase [Humidesulfovibrio sp.]
RVAERVFRIGASKTGLDLTVSAGVASLPPGGTAQDLVLMADQALYVAKNNGRNRVVLAGPSSLLETHGIKDQSQSECRAGAGSRSLAAGREAELGMVRNRVGM